MFVVACGFAMVNMTDEFRETHLFPRAHHNAGYLLVFAILGSLSVWLLRTSRATPATSSPDNHTDYDHS